MAPNSIPQSWFLEHPAHPANVTRGHSSPPSRVILPSLFRPQYVHQPLAHICSSFARLKTPSINSTHSLSLRTYSTSNSISTDSTTDLKTPCRRCHSRTTGQRTGYVAIDHPFLSFSLQHVTGSTDILQTIYLVGAALFVSFIAYSFWTSSQTSTSSQPSPALNSSKGASQGASQSSAPKKQHHYNPGGDPQRWSEEDMKKFLTSRNMGVGHDPTRNELLAMVESKLHEPV